MLASNIYTVPFGNQIVMNIRLLSTNIFPKYPKHGISAESTENIR